MHNEWCGNRCSECGKPCAADEKIPCSPDCELLGEYGFPIDIAACLLSGCDAYEK